MSDCRPSAAPLCDRMLMPGSPWRVKSDFKSIGPSSIEWWSICPLTSCWNGTYACSPSTKVQWAVTGELEKIDPNVIEEFSPGRAFCDCGIGTPQFASGSMRKKSRQPRATRLTLSAPSCCLARLKRCSIPNHTQSATATHRQSAVFAPGGLRCWKGRICR